MNNDASDGSISRRHLLVLSAGTAAVAACGTPVHFADGGDSAPTADGDNTTDAGGDDAQTMTDAQMCTAGDPNSQAGMVTDFAVGTWTQIDTRPDGTDFNIIVSQDATGLFAFSDVCTHEGCIVNPPSATGVTYCACHGSRFDGNGAVVSGVARRPLPHFAVSVCDGAVYVNTSMTVTASHRTPAG